MNPTKNDIPAKKRPALIVLLNERLADLIDLKLQAKQAHWNVKGPDFIALHKLFDDVAGEVDLFVDSVAERAVMLGGTAAGTLSAVTKTTSLAAYPADIKAGHDHVEALSSAVAGTVKGLRAAIDTAASAGDAVTADLFTQVAGDLDKQLWFIEAHLQGGAKKA